MTITSNIKTQQGVSNLKDAGRNFQDAAESQANAYGSDIANAANKAGQKVGEVARQAMTTAQDYANMATEKADQFRGRVDEFSHEVEDQIRARPMQSAAIALATGVILGLLLRK